MTRGDLARTWGASLLAVGGATLLGLAIALAVQALTGRRPDSDTGVLLWVSAAYAAGAALLARFAWALLSSRESPIPAGATAARAPAHLAPVQPGPHACPCCGFLTLSERGAFEICDVCFWEDDGQDSQDADAVRGGPNGPVSLTQARTNYAAFGACDETSAPHARPPRPEEVPG